MAGGVFFEPRRQASELDWSTFSALNVAIVSEEKILEEGEKNP